MAAIWNEIILDWEGETYNVRPTIDFLNHLEQGSGSSLTHLLIRLGNNDLPSGKACELISKTLNYAGAKTTPEDVFLATGGVNVDMMQAAQIILVGCMPAPQDDKPKKKATRKKASK